MKKSKLISCILCFMLFLGLVCGVVPANTSKVMAAAKSYWIFDFGTASSSVGSNYTQITPSTVYSSSLGYGFTSTTGFDSRDRGAPDYVRQDFVLCGSACTFKADVPNGSYTVRIISGDNIASSALTSVKAEGTTVISNASASAGNFIEKIFNVTVSDGQLTLDFAASIVRINAIEINTAATPSQPTVYIAGDSTVQSYSSSYAPQQGWGKRIPEYFTTGVSFVNKAIGGRSSKSFYVQGRLDEIIALLHKNDYLFVQMGHNDADSSNSDRYADPAAYKVYLKRYIDGARAKGATPVLITPVARLHYSNGVFINDFPAYCTAMKEVAAETGTQCIDLMTKSLTSWTSLGYNAVYPFYMVSSNGTDYTHFTETGAYKVAGLVSQGVKEINIPISQYVK